jgi:hypothetical protein
MVATEQNINISILHFECLSVQQQQQERFRLKIEG